MSSTVIITSRKSGVLCNKQNDKVGNIRMGGSSPSKHECFLYYSKIADLLSDDNWKHFFEVMAKGSFWKGLKFDGKQLIAKKKNTVKTYLITITGTMDIEEDIEEDYFYYNECKEFIKANSSHFTQTESKTSNDADNEVIKTGFQNSVSKQTVFIEEFSARKCYENGLNENYKECLVSSIISKISDKTLVPKSSFIFGTNGVIESINGLYVDSSGYSFDTNLKKSKSAKDNDEEDTVSKKIQFKCSKNLAKCLKKTPLCHR